jgi:hypothetical protein
LKTILEKSCAAGRTGLCAPGHIQPEPLHNYLILRSTSFLAPLCHLRWQIKAGYSDVVAADRPHLI